MMSMKCWRLCGLRFAIVNEAGEDAELAKERAEEIINAIRIEEEFMGGILVDPLMDGGQLEWDKLPDVWGTI
ncbi:hypothetical protein V6N11_065562 [Hibiscus sabdariffa]|uniref:Uncharacterized protein n=1 Tax=Hibiscus sabdariffa TaxID=183260 RepID=A0ABR2PHN7_9ROSI